MPIYEYECNACSHEFETMRKMSDAPLTMCPACGEDELKKLISKVAFRLKGTGWYETDFKDKPKDAKTSTSDGESAGSDAAKSGEKTDSKPATDKKDSTPKETKSSSNTETAKKSSTKSEN